MISPFSLVFDRFFANLAETLRGPLETVKLPSSLERLTLGEQFSQSLEAVNFPSLSAANGWFGLDNLKDVQCQREIPSQNGGFLL